MSNSENPVTYCGELIERITTAARNFGVLPHSEICVRVGDFGPELQIEHVKVQGGLNGPKIVLQVKGR